MGSYRLCSRSACRRTAIATLTYVYADSTAVLGPLATYPEPHCYDLCPEHADRLTVPRGWTVLRLELPARPRLAPDELSALADAVAESPRGPAQQGFAQQQEPAPHAPAQPGTTPEATSGRTAPGRMEPPADAVPGRATLRILHGPS